MHEGYLPEAHRRENLDEELDWAFGNLGILDKAKHYATLFIEELGDFIQATVDEFFAFTKYAEQIASSASSYDKIHEFLSYETTLVEGRLLQLMDEKIVTEDMRQKVFENFSTTDDHLMHLTGLYKAANGNYYYLTKNSHGKDRYDWGGFVYMSEAYVRMNTMAIMIHKDALPKEIAKKLGL